MNASRPIIAETLQQLLAERGRAVRPPEDADSLTGTLGLDSLDLAVLVVRLEQRLGVDPFRHGRPLVATFGEFVALYSTDEAAL